MQDHITKETTVIEAKTRLANAIINLEKIVISNYQKQSQDDKIRDDVVKELGTYIDDLENILLAKQE